MLCEHLRYIRRMFARMFAEPSSCGHSRMFSEHSRKTFGECFANIYRKFAQKHSLNVLRTFKKRLQKCCLDMLSRYRSLWCAICGCTRLNFSSVFLVFYSVRVRVQPQMAQSTNHVSRFLEMQWWRLSKELIKISLDACGLQSLWLWVTCLVDRECTVCGLNIMWQCTVTATIGLSLGLIKLSLASVLARVPSLSHSHQWPGPWPRLTSLGQGHRNKNMSDLLACDLTSTVRQSCFYSSC